MKKTSGSKRRSVDFSKGVRGKYSEVKLIIAVDRSTQRKQNDHSDAEVLRKVSRVLKSAGPSKRDLEAAINRARDIIESSRQV